MKQTSEVMKNDLKQWKPPLETDPAAKNNLEMETMPNMDALPTPTMNLPFAVGKTPWTIRGTMIPCTARRRPTLTVRVVLNRFPLTETTLLWITLDTQVFAPIDMTSNVVKTWPTLTLNVRVVLQQTITVRMTTGALWKTLTQYDSKKPIIPHIRPPYFDLVIGTAWTILTTRLTFNLTTALTKVTHNAAYVFDKNRS